MINHQHPVMAYADRIISLGPGVAHDGGRSSSQARRLTWWRKVHADWRALGGVREVTAGAG